MCKTAIACKVANQNVKKMIKLDSSSQRVLEEIQNDFRMVADLWHVQTMLVYFSYCMLFTWIYGGLKLLKMF